jgi:hypothetical protein|tara:strand:+ start:513 stop:1052 length:540 start_codon:yes stop_codon:yes gene_type:complete
MTKKDINETQDQAQIEAEVLEAAEVKDDSRTPRETRGNEQRADTQRTQAWQPPSVLPDPNPQDGWVFRWIRTATVGQSDNPNVSYRFREGWEACKAEDHPELKIMCDQDSRWASDGCIEIGGLLLCKAPAELVKSRQEYYDKLAVQQVESIDNNYLRESDPRMPMLEPQRQTRTTFGKH